MSADQNILREYLVALGFKVDTAEHDKFDKKVKIVDKSMLNLGKTLLAVAAGTVAMVDSFAGQMEKLYYASQRSGATAENLSNIQYAAKQIGLSSDVVTNSIQAMGAAIRSQPGIKEFIEGVLGHDITGEDTAKVWEEVMKRLKVLMDEGPQGVAVANAIGAKLGLDPDTIFMVTKNLDQLIEAERKHEERLKHAGIDMNEAAEQGKKYKQALADLGDEFGVLEARLSKDLLPGFQVFVGWMEKGIEKLIDFGNLKDKTTKSFSQKSLWEKFLDPFGDGEVTLNWFQGKYDDKAKPIALKHPGQRAAVAAAAAAGAVGSPTAVPIAAPGASKPLPRGLRLHNPGNLRSWGDAPIVNGFASFASDEEGLSAMAGNLVSYAFKHGLRTVKDVIGRWAPASDHNDTAAYIANVAKALGVSPDQQLNLGDAQTVSKMMDAIIKQEQGYNPFDQTKLGKAAGDRLTPVTIQQKTDIHVNGNADPRRTADAVRDEQKVVNADLVRSAGVVR